MEGDHNNTAELADSSSSAAGTASFASSWENTDTTGLAPTNLPLAKVQRAWERRPQSPFSKRRFKVGKIFKRNATNAQPVASALGSAFSVNIRENAGRGTPVKAVKKMRVARDSLGGIGGEALVSDWECRGSPANRRIVTRSSLGKEELVALTDEDQEDAHLGGQELEVAGNEGDVEGTSIEILNEDGSQRVEDGEDANTAADEWEDESDTEVEEDEEAEEQAWERCRQDAIAERESMSPNDAIVASSWQEQDIAPTGQAAEAEDPGTNNLEADAPKNDNASGLIEQQDAEEQTLQADHQSPIATATHEKVVLPEGFVSPIATRRRRSVNQAKQNTSRRRTLPTSFSAPSKKQEQVSADQQSTAEGDDSAERNEKPEPTEDPAAVTYQIEDARPGDEQLIQETIEQEAEEAAHGPRSITPEPSREISTEPNTPLTEFQLVTEYQQENGLLSPSKVASSPVPTIEGSHPRLPLRRSPRRQRQSSSPVKRRSILKQTLQKPHLVAFTPIKKSAEQEPQPEPQAEPSPKVTSGPGSSPLPIEIDFAGITSPTAIQDELPIRSSSAPPEEPQMSPRKPYQPRISDDTALLEAFLKRASESKSGRRISDTARRESLENRRNSDTVRQALASPAVKSPAPSDVLADLDPNSPSPRKPLGVAFSMTVPEKRELEYEEDPIRDDEDELAAESGPPQKFGSRKSGRTRKKPETLPATTYDGKTRIQIRTNGEGVVLKKTEAQALALETKKNTRLNKSGAVMPPLRLTKLAAEKKKDSSQPVEDDAMDVEQPPVPGRKGIKWAETLVSFYQGEDEPEGSMMVDELGNEQPFDPMAPENNTLKEGEMSFVTAPPASSTPSKPKLRRLKPQKPTASTPAKPSLPLEQTLSKGEDEQEIDVKPKPKTSTRRKVSRIATPAKVKGKTLLGQSQEEIEEQAQLGELKPRPTPMPSSVQKLADQKKVEEPQAAPVATKKTSSAAAKKKPIVASKLPAPATSQQSSVSHPTTGLAAGKENSLIASPPKKRSTKASNLTAAPPLKLGEAKGLAPKLDLGKALKPSDNEKSAPAGISSPAKKAPRMMPARSTISNERRTEIEPAPGLGSPAKKRTRSMAS
ncbi:hypothetical protein HII31_02922 [Pseudocercospora fuligena]|uniref:Uncharacterized protein n=1 Tax=Pseudocercospora fuligena TaxID=685502 RepID=A0A8H6RS07_9PEZI|nr:hypothetical protein HII31_02922 [Pseudocercospora fuligena]